MLNAVATVDREDDNAQVDHKAAQLVVPRTHGAGVMRFTYATGSRPLEGFTIKRGIGIGGFGEVYFAVSDAGKEVALKRIQRSMDVEVRGASQCLNLKHQNLIGLFDIRYDDEGQAWVVMEYVSGESLKDVIERFPQGMPEDEVLRWFRGIAAGVAYLHDHGIIHRDLKPANIFIDESVIKIGDYGLSKFISCSRRSGQTESVGTFHYMAPEIGKGVYGKEIDIYALGIMLCELLSGRVPIDGESSQEIIMKHLTASPDLRGVAERYRPVIERALAKDPVRRFGSVSEMLAKVEAAHSGVTVIPPVRKAPSAATFQARSEVRLHDDGIYFGPVREVSSQCESVKAKPVPLASSEGPSEPIAKAVWSACRQLRARWDRAAFSTPVKLLMLVGVVIFVAANAAWLFPLGLSLGVLYLVYLGVYSLVSLQKSPSPTPPAAAPNLATARPEASAPRRAELKMAEPPPARPKRVPWQQQARLALRERTVSEQLGELSGSLLTAAIVACVASLFMVLIGGEPIESVYTWTLYAWMAVASTVGAWGILAISKLWESSPGDQLRRRFVMSVIGLAIGLAAHGAGAYLDVRPTGGFAASNSPLVDTWAAMYGDDLAPKLPAFLVYFAGLFAVSRWWLQSDPLRATRLSVFATAVCVLWAWVVHLILPFPQPWGLMLAATISIAVQLAAPWMSLSERARIRNAVMEA